MADHHSPNGHSPNRLAQETSPYLRQHADNPVDWRPWSEDALEEARASGKPVLLSVGYAACHWCHVMAHESFENPETAAVMNDLFINIKVDREERPDLDLIYQRALALMGEHGGWPLTMFLNGHGEPFWGGTYFPPEPRYGRPGFVDLLRKIAALYRDKADAVAQNAERLKDALKGMGQSTPGEGIGPAIPHHLAEALLSRFDPVHGGVGQAPKFPHVPIYELVLADSLNNGTEEGKAAVALALTRMSQGGIYDHLGGGYSRYATDEAWLVPHFEKMLYDNAQMIEILRLAWLATGDPLYAARVEETVAWLLREMPVKEPGETDHAFAGTLDADSEGGEGLFYVWDEREIDTALGEDAALFKRVYGVTGGGNFEGRTILNRLGQIAPLDATSEARLATARKRLLALRDARPRPARDDKILADWNGLLIAALARAGASLQRPDWLDAARSAFRFIATRMSPAPGRLVHSRCQGQNGEEALLDDYAAMALAAIALHETCDHDTGDGETRGGEGPLEQAEAWLETLDRLFRDGEGGYFLTPETTRLLVRPKTAEDGPVPAGNALVATASARLWLLTGATRHRDRAEAILRDFAGGLERNAYAYVSLVNAARLLQDSQQVVLIEGKDAEPEAAEALARVVWTRPDPDLVVQRIVATETLPEGHPARGKSALDGRATAYLCRGPVCSPPLTEPEALARALARP